MSVPGMIPNSLAACQDMIMRTVRKCAQTPQLVERPVWAVVRTTIGIGRNSAQGLCAGSGIDPDAYAPVADINDGHGNCRYCGNAIEEDA